MTIRRFNDWGQVIARPEVVELCNSDAEVAQVASHYKQSRAPIPHVSLTGGSLALSLGDPPTSSTTDVHELPIDLLHVSYRMFNNTQITSVVANSVVMRHKWWLGQVVAITNGGYLGSWEIAPRAHPNDGVFDVVEVAADMSYRQRQIARRRLPHGTHVPHPSIRRRQSRSDTWIFAKPIGLYLDEKYLGRITQIHVTIEPDALRLVV